MLVVALPYLKRLVLTLCNEGEIEKDIADSESMVARIIGVNNANAEKIKEYEHLSQVATGESIVSQFSMPITGATNSFEMKTAKPKSPKLNLPKFKGDVTSFTTFWEIFESAIDKNEGLADIDKFHYLHSLY